MNSTDLFSFLSETAPEDEHGSEQDILETVPARSPTITAHKRKAESDDDFPGYVPKNGNTTVYGVGDEPESVYKKPRMGEIMLPNAPRKRSSAGDGDISVVPPQLGDTVIMQDVNNDPGPSAPKRARMASPKPMLLDDFETEAKREVPASAGLTGNVDTGTRLELKHQVRS